MLRCTAGRQPPREHPDEDSRRDERWRRRLLLPPAWSMPDTRWSVHMAIDRAGTLRRLAGGIVVPAGDAADAPHVAGIGIPFLCFGISQRSSKEGRDQRLPCRRLPAKLRALACGAISRSSSGRQGCDVGFSIRWPRGGLRRRRVGGCAAPNRPGQDRTCAGYSTAQQLRHAAVTIGDTPKRQIVPGGRLTAVANKPKIATTSASLPSRTQAFWVRKRQGSPWCGGC